MCYQQRAWTDGPMIGIQAPKRGQSVYTRQPAIEISYSDFDSAVDTATLQVSLTDEQSVTNDITADLTITANSASGTLSTSLTEDTSYTLSVFLSDTLGNLSRSEARFYVPADLTTIVPPEELEHAGWVSGVDYDTELCNEHLTTCEPLTGARVTLTYAGTWFPNAEELGLNPPEAIPGTIITGPDDFFVFPVGETNTYWLRVEKDGYTYAQREVEIVRQHSTATNEIYLTPIDPAMTVCDAAGCSHTSSDDMLQVIIMAWEHEGVGIVDATGEWLVMTVEHFSPFDCNDPVTPPDFEGDSDDETQGDGTSGCAGGEENACFIDYKTGRFQEDYSLPAVTALGQDIAPRLVYTSRRANPNTVIDIAFTLQSVTPVTELGDYVEFTLYINGQKTDTFSLAADIQPGSTTGIVICGTGEMDKDNSCRLACTSTG